MESDRLVYAFDTSYGHYEVVDTIYNGRPARVLYAGNRLSAQSGMPLDGESELLFDYNQRFMELVLALKPARLLLIGGGTMTLPTAILAVLPTIEIDVVEIDDGLLPVAEQFFDFQPTARTRVHYAGGAAYIAECDRQYDVVLLDVFVGTTIPPAFQAAELLQQVARLVRPRGVLAMNIIASYYGQRSQVLRREIAGFQAAFQTVQLYPAGYEPSLWSIQNFILTGQHAGRNLQPFLRHKALPLPDNTGDMLRS